MGRAIVRNPQVFLMDEPLSNLDAKLRVKMRVDIAALQRRLGVTMLYVTHDQVEAMTMGQRVAVLRDGQPAAVRPAARAVQPAGERVRGRLHRLAGDEPVPGAPQRRRRGRAVRRHGRAPARRPWPPPARAACASVVVGLRPESLEIDDADGIHAEVEVVEELGADAYAFCVARAAAATETS